MRAIVFGGSGFLGSHVADALSAKGWTVRVFDKAASDWLRRGQEMVVGDILDPAAVKRAVAGCRVVYNFAGVADLDDALTKPVATAQQNILGNLNVLEAAAATGVRRYVYASTIYVYSDKGGFYRCSKQASELYIEEFARRFGLRYTILRYGTLYGPRADRRNSVHRYLEQALKEGRIVCSGDGEEMREYVHVRDAAALSAEILKPEYADKHIIITGHHPMRFKDMLLMIQEILGRRIKLELRRDRSRDHYAFTPYSFAPKVGRKLVSHCYTDMGQGLLECLQELHGRGRGR
ncbi:MAG: NAD(P)-dependent oxidoreductase [Elusimicrobia bacterium]|nr:NAD(P)-dependent oxidoreductase [Elusimicrobiota bacterium]